MPPLPHPPPPLLLRHGRASITGLDRALHLVTMSPRCAHRITVTTFVSEPEAPWLSVTVTRIVWLPKGRRYVCDAVNVPWLDRLPLEDDPSPQLIVYDQ